MKVGDRLKDIYEVTGVLGRGGMGHVFSGVHLPTKKPVALKVLLRVGQSQRAIARVEREAEALARIDSQHVPHVYDVDWSPRGELFIVMDRIEGEPLSDYLVAHGGTLPWEQTLCVAQDVLEGLTAAHRVGVIHRDLKPSNVFVGSDDDGRVFAFVIDFGVCKLNDEEFADVTGAGESVGTIAYMAPEQIRGASSVDERADVYAVATLIYEMVTGRLPYDTAGQVAQIAAKLEAEPPPLRRHARVAHPPGLDTLIARNLSREPAARMRTTREFSKALGALGAPTAAPRGMPIVERRASGEVAIAVPPTRTGPWGLVAEQLRQARVRRAVLAVLTGVFIAGAAYLIARLKSPPARPVGAPTPGAGASGPASPVRAVDAPR